MVSSLNTHATLELVWYPAYSAHKSTYNVTARAGNPGYTSVDINLNLLL